AADAVTTKQPSPRSSQPGIRRRAAATCERTFTANARSQTSSGVCSSAPIATPAFAKNTSTGPKRSSHCAISAPSSSSEVTSQLPAQLRALRQPGRAQRMALGDQAARGVDEPLAAIAGLPLLHEPLALALAAQAERFVGDQLVRGEAVMQLDHLDVLGPDLRGL